MSSRSFHDFLREHKQGETHDRISDLMQELAAAVGAEHRAGKLVITISMKPAGDTGAFELTVDPVLKAPKPSTYTSLFYLTPENNLTKQSPQQIMDLGPTIVHKGVA